MTVFATTVTVLSCSLFTASLIKMLSPSGRTEKILKLIISLFVLICVISCIKSVVDNFKLTELSSNEQSVNLGSEIDKSILETTGNYMVEYTENLLASQGIDAKRINITVNTDENGVINITEVRIYLDIKNSSEKNRISELIKADLKITPSLIVEE